MNRSTCLASAYLHYFVMLLTHVIHHLAEGFSELLNERRFQVGGNGRSAEELLLSPICGHLSVTWPRPATLDTQCTVDAFYDSISRYILGQFSIAAIGWCRPWYEGKTTDSLSHADGENIAC